MKNALVTITHHLNIGEGTVHRILNARMLQEDDGSDEWYASACKAIEAAVQDDLPQYLEFASDEPDVEVDA